MYIVMTHLKYDHKYKHKSWSAYYIVNRKCINGTPLGYGMCQQNVCKFLCNSYLYTAYVSASLEGDECTSSGQPLLQQWAMKVNCTDVNREG